MNIEEGEKWTKWRRGEGRDRRHTVVRLGATKGQARPNLEGKAAQVTSSHLDATHDGE